MINENFEPIPLGRAKDLTNQKFGYLTVLYRIKNSNNGKTRWACKCDCGNIIGVIGTDLINHHTQSCGCKRVESAKNNVKSEIGNKYGRLTVLERAGSTSDRHALWKCQCECGNIVEVTGRNLRNGTTKSCGCYMKEKSAKHLHEVSSNNYINEIGNRYGKLVVIEKLDKKAEDFWGTLWKCKCDCGNIKITRGQYLREGIVSSCGCLTISKGELAISQLLQNNNIDFKAEYNININKINYRYDFAILNQDNLKYLIEYDGIGHYEPRQFKGISKKQAIEIFNNQQNNDKIKNQWCKENNIPLIRIPYTHLEKLCIEDLLPETSNFLI